MSVSPLGNLTRSAFVAASVFCAIGCVNTPTGPVDAGMDLRARPDLAFPDSGSDLALSDVPMMDDAPPSRGVSLTLHDGTLIEGERVHSYDHRVWWDDASESWTFAIFRPGRLSPEMDRSLRFVSSVDVASEQPVTLDQELFVDARRRLGLVLERPPLMGVSHVFTANDSYHLEENGYGDFAYDLVVTDGAEERFRNAGLENRDYFVWERDVFLPTGGVVFEVVRDAPDNEPGAYAEDARNNWVGVSLYGGYYLYLLHFREGSIPDEITAGLRLETGAFLGQVGNSGVSLEPHLHVVLLAADPDATPFRSWSVPVEFANVYTAETLRGAAEFHAYAAPPSKSFISAEAF